LYISHHFSGQTALPDTCHSGIVAPATLPTMTSSRGSNSLWELTTGIALVDKAQDLSDLIPFRVCKLLEYIMFELLEYGKMNYLRSFVVNST
jgi:hypothetical protein